MGVPWPDRTLVEEVVGAEHGYLEDVTVVRELSQDQPYEVEDVSSLTYAAPLRLAEHILRYFMDLLRSKDNSFRGNREPKVLARVSLRILRYVNRHKYPGLDESRWPLSPFYMRVIRKMVRKVSEFEGCDSLRRSTAWRGVKWYLKGLAQNRQRHQKGG